MTFTWGSPLIAQLPAVPLGRRIHVRRLAKAVVEVLPNLTELFLVDEVHAFTRRLLTEDHGRRVRGP
ncbi:hypothetical protein [Amycolatopsis sp. WAC 04182]|uniref:hypothetical protein n=1 Tax=Amycolatopsis sp. WAC 04182 TaxID=2203198 RepID=UPI000F7B52F5|nr:hypothetical protein [Amycolatopsis sp. WAC 04182]